MGALGDAYTQFYRESQPPLLTVVQHSEGVYQIHRINPSSGQLRREIGEPDFPTRQEALDRAAQLNSEFIAARRSRNG
jgi:hypothetical protein